MAKVVNSAGAGCVAVRVAVAVCFLVTAEALATPIAVANGPYVFDADHLALPLDSTGSHDPGGGSLVDYDWTAAGATLTGPSPSLGIADSGLTATTDSNTVALVVTNNHGDPSGPDGATVSYANAAPVVTGTAAAWGGKAPDVLLEFSAAYDDADFGVNPLIGAFERTWWEFDTSPAAGASDVGDGFLTVWGDLDRDARGEVLLSDLLGLLGPGPHTVYFNVVDRAGQVASSDIDVEVAVPEPGTLALGLTALLALSLPKRAAPGPRRRRR